MGGLWSRVFNTKHEYGPYRILIQGLDASGKTTILYRLKLGKVDTIIPNIGFNLETLTFQNVSIAAWDVGGRDKTIIFEYRLIRNQEGLETETKNLTKLFRIVAKTVKDDDLKRPLFRLSYPNTEAIVYVVDSNDRKRLDQAKDELHAALCEDDRWAGHVVILANKQDLSQAMTTEEISKMLGMDKVKQNWGKLIEFIDGLIGG